MAVCKRNAKIFNHTIKMTAVFAVMGIFTACGGDSGSGSNNDSDSGQVGELVEPSDSDIVADSFDDLPVCSGKREGFTAYVKDEKAAYVCEAGDWNPDKGTDKDPMSVEGTSSSGKPKSSSSEDDSPDGFVRENISVTGVAQKGPFKFGSPLNLYELKKDLKPSGLVYEDEISSNKGDFVIPKVSLAYPYAKLEVRGLYRNEVTGEWSTDSMTLRALTDFSDKRTEVNINLLTHLEYDRVLYLVQEKGYSVYAAKKQAAQEIMTAFEFATAVTYSEDFAIFQNEEVSAGTIVGNASLLAISSLIMGNRSDAEIQSTIDKFIADIKTDGEWNDLQAKADMADWAYDLDYKTIRASVKSWNILDIPDFETFLDAYWNNMYGLGGCSVNRKDVVATNSNKLSKYYNKYFVCTSEKWIAATTFQKDTYQWTDGKIGEFKKGNVTDTIYVYNGSKWEVSEMGAAIGICEAKNAGVVSKYNDVYYICRDNVWTKATEFESDTYGWKGDEGDIRTGNVNGDKYYVYESGKWRVLTGEVIDFLGKCGEEREGEIDEYKSSYFGESISTFYICKANIWKIASPLEMDTYGWGAGTNGEVRTGRINADKFYVYENGVWRASANEIENKLGACVTDREGEVGSTGYGSYICKSRTWTVATYVEYQTNGEMCTSADLGKIINGQTYGKYYCSANGWVDMSRWSWDVPKEVRLNPDISYGIMTDSRDGQKYKTIKIGSQVWMAENLNYADSVTTPSLKGNSWCYENKTEYCAVAGRLYTWFAAKNACPTGWHLPNNVNWEALFDAVGGYTSGGVALMASTPWLEGDDSFGFSAIPSTIYKASWHDFGAYCDEGCDAYFWSYTQSENDSESACSVMIENHPGYEDDNEGLHCNLDKNFAMAVRCVMD